MPIPKSLMLVLVAVFTAAGPVRAAPDADVPPELEGLPQRWSEAMADFRVPGFAVVVVRDDRVIYRGVFGHRDLGARKPVTPSTAFYIASATKPFTAMGIMKLVDDGKVNLDDPVKKYLPKFELPDAGLAARITVRDLLSHRPGIECPDVVLLDAYTGEITDDRYYRLLKTHGTAVGATRYSNIHFTLAGRVIEAASGMPWRDYLVKHIFKPAGMTGATGYADAMYARDDVAIPYRITPDGPQPAPRKTDATMHAAGGLGMSIDDLAIWLRLNLAGGQIDGRRIISEASAAEMLRLQSEAAEGQIRVRRGFGLGWGIGTFRPNGPAYVMHSGGYVGAAAHTSFLPQQRIGVAVLTNGDGPAAVFAESAVSIDVLDRFVGGDHDDFLESTRRRLPEWMQQAQGRQPAMPVDVTAVGALTAAPTGYAGEYYSDDFGTLQVRLDGKSFKMQLGTLPLTISSCAEDRFVAPNGGNEIEGRFEMSEGKAAAVILHLASGEARFDRRN